MPDQPIQDLIDEAFAATSKELEDPDKLAAHLADYAKLKDEMIAGFNAIQEKYKPSEVPEFRRSMISVIVTEVCTTVMTLPTGMRVLMMKEVIDTIYLMGLDDGKGIGHE